jgi:flagellum-specific ATP synthase
LGSVSRLATQVTGPTIKRAVGKLRRLLAVYREAEDLINVGAYVEGSSPEIDEAIAKMPEINAFLVQGIEEGFAIDDILRRMGEIVEIVIPEEELGSEAVSLSAGTAARA